MISGRKPQQRPDSRVQLLPGGLPGPYLLPDDQHHVFRSAHGSRLVTTESVEFIDHVGGAGALILGHGHPAVVEAAQRQLGRAMHLFGVHNEPALELAERLVDTVPCAERIAYATTGSEATAYAMRMARAATGRDLVLKFEGGYHGNHDYALVSTFPSARSDFPHGHPDTGGQPAATRSTILVAPFNDLATVEQIFSDHSGRIAGIIVECVQRIIPADDTFLGGLRELCDRSGAVLIFDEVVTGFRLGPTSAQGHYGVHPDLATFGKIIGAGGPLSCVAGRADLLDHADPRRRGGSDHVYLNGTLHGNPVAAAATLAMLDELADPNVYELLDATTGRLCVGAQAALDRHGVPAIAVHVGSLWQILFTDGPPRSYADIAAGDSLAMRRLDAELLRQGHFVLPGVRRFVSTAHTDADIDATIKAIDRACARFVEHREPTQRSRSSET